MERKQWVRFIVVNDGQDGAQRVEIIASDLKREDAEGTLRLVDGFIPTALVWTHSKTVLCDYLLCIAEHWPDRSRFCTADNPKSHHKGMPAV